MSEEYIQKGEFEHYKPGNFQWSNEDQEWLKKIHREKEMDFDKYVWGSNFESPDQRRENFKRKYSLENTEKEIQKLAKQSPLVRHAMSAGEKAGLSFEEILGFLVFQLYDKTVYQENMILGYECSRPQLEIPKGDNNEDNENI